MSSHVFVDETKRRRYTLVAVIVPSADVARMRKSMRQLLLPGQERVHFRKESDPRRKVILARAASKSLAVVVVNSDANSDGAARRQCFDALVRHLARQHESAHIVVEQDDSLVKSDMTLLTNLVRAVFQEQQITFEITAARFDPGLWCADAIGWAIQRGGSWRRRVEMHKITSIEA